MLYPKECEKLSNTINYYFSLQTIPEEIDPLVVEIPWLHQMTVDSKMDITGEGTIEELANVICQRRIKMDMPCRMHTIEHKLNWYRKMKLWLDRNNR